ncbi:hypothetical protein AKH17_00245 [Pelagibacteraceae bacterium GOM-A2]|nr:hypothetical protein AKH17_00245 [Pelagibacteraceae bacterium GOM-A2]
MSIKSLLQLILFMLIILILGSIYFIYFYSKYPNNDTSFQNKIYEIENKSDAKINLDQEILEDKKFTINSDQQKQNTTISNKSNEIKKNTKLKKEINLVKEKKIDNISNLTKDIEHITTNKNGDIYKVLAKYGRTNLKNNDILDLEKVDGIISSSDKSKLYITSDYARYNYINYDSEFYSNVIIKYDGNVITCNNLKINLKKNIAVAYNNVIVERDNSVMKAQKISMDLKTKDIIINSDNKIKVTTE